MKAQQELPLYRTHSTDETVRAVKIDAIEIHADKSATIAPADKNFSPFTTPPGWANVFAGSEADKGYFVQYPDSVEHWISTPLFEHNYSLATTAGEPAGDV